MENSLYRPRIIDSVIKEKLALSKAVCIQGPKASGKTWASLNQASSALMLGDSANNFANRRLTMLDVSFAVTSSPSCLTTNEPEDRASSHSRHPMAPVSVSYPR